MGEIVGFPDGKHREKVFLLKTDTKCE